MPVERRTREQWVHELSRPGAALTITELLALCLMELRDNALLARLATEHLEGMVGAVDEMCSRMDPAYKSDGQVRAALDAARDEQRRLAAVDVVPARDDIRAPQGRASGGP
jgi:hypothetical protein